MSLDTSNVAFYFLLQHRIYKEIYMTIQLTTNRK